MRPRQIETFFAVMTYGTVTQAALRLGVTQPSVTTTLRQAEGELGFSLFHRRGGRLEPTAEAHLLYDEVSRAQASLSAVRNLCTRIREGQPAELRVASVQSLNETVLPEATNAFVKSTSGCHLAISAEPSSRILQQLEKGHDFDIGLVYGNTQDHAVYSIEIAEIPIMCVARRDMEISQHDGMITPSAIHGQPLISLSELEPVGREVRAFLNRNGVKPEITISAQNHLFAARLASMGLGYALVDGLTAKRIRRLIPDEVQILTVEGVPSITITAVLARASKLTQPARAFLKCLTNSVEMAQAL